MAFIDVSDLLLDPDFVDKISIIRRSAGVNSRGENMVSEFQITTVGSVQPASAKAISRLPESLRVGDVRSFFVKIPIVMDGSCEYPDILVFNGKRFQVQTAAPWLNFGAGWNEGVCIGEQPSL